MQPQDHAAKIYDAAVNEMNAALRSRERAGDVFEHLDPVEDAYKRIVVVLLTKIAGELEFANRRGG